MNKYINRISNKDFHDRTISRHSFIAILVFLFLSGIGVANAQTWTPPTASPPDGNVASPLNTGSSAQSKIGGAIFNTGGATYGLLIPFGNVGIGTLTPVALFHVSNVVPTIDLFRITAGSNVVVVNSSGKVGIGTTTPVEKLEVAGNIKLTGVSPTYKITNVAVPTASSDVATKGYVDAQAADGSPGSWMCTIRTASAGYGESNSVFCAGSEKVISGGCSFSPQNSDARLVGDHPAEGGGQGWTCNNDGYTWSTVFANCCL
mgnify:FL=1